MTRVCWIVGIRPEKIAEYRALHDACWPEVLNDLKRLRISDFRIFLREPQNLLVATFAYHGDDLAADLARDNPGPRSALWAELTDACQVALPGAQAGETWLPMTEIFHAD